MADWSRIGPFAASALSATSSFGQTAAPVAEGRAGDSLEAQFRDPPSEARPRVWWHWVDGNISKDGIEKDLAWMAGHLPFRCETGGCTCLEYGIAGRPAEVFVNGRSADIAWEAPYRLDTGRLFGPRHNTLEVRVVNQSPHRRSAARRGQDNLYHHSDLHRACSASPLRLDRAGVIGG